MTLDNIDSELNGFSAAVITVLWCICCAWCEFC